MKTIPILAEQTFTIGWPDDYKDRGERMLLKHLPVGVRTAILSAREENGSRASDNTPVIGFEQAYLCEHEATGKDPYPLGWIGRYSEHFSISVHIFRHGFRMYPTYHAPGLKSFTNSSGILHTSYRAEPWFPVTLTLQAVDLGAKSTHILCKLKNAFDSDFTRITILDSRQK